MKRDAGPSILGFVWLATVTLTPACASMRPPAQNSGPTLSTEGVQLAVLRQSCTQSQEPDQTGNDLAEAVVEVQVRNAAPAPVTIRRTAFRLLTPDGFALKTMTWGSADALVLAGGETRAFEIRFMSRGSLACGRELQLDPGAGVCLGGKSVKMKAVTFTPSTTEPGTAAEPPGGCVRAS